MTNNVKDDKQMLFFFYHANIWFYCTFRCASSMCDL